MNGPLEPIAPELRFEGDMIMEGFILSIFIVGAFSGSVGGGIFADKLGRKRTLQLDAIPLVLGDALGWLLQSSEAIYEASARSELVTASSPLSLDWTYCRSLLTAYHAFAKWLRMRFLSCRSSRVSTPKASGGLDRAVCPLSWPILGDRGCIGGCSQGSN